MLEGQYQQPGQTRCIYQESRWDCKDGTGHGSMDHGQNTEDFWQMTPIHSDLNLTGEGLTGVTDTELHALEPHS